MSIIKENLLPTQGSLPSSWFLRMVSDTGMSKRIASSLVKWTIGDITDLATSLDAKQDLSTLKSMAAYLDSTGQSVGSGFFMGTISDTTDLDAAFCGLYTAPVPFSITNIGDVYGALAISRNAIGEDFATEDNTSSAQLIFTSNGLYLRSYSTSWGLYRYVGGGVQPQPVTRAQLIDLMYEGELVQGTKYIITDHPNDMGIIVEAASSSLLSQYALRLACQPKYYVAGDYFSGSGGTVEETWEGVYEIGFTPTAGHIYVFAGMVYKNLTDDDGTPPGGYILNSTDWELQTVEWGSYYSPNICEVIYKIGLTSSPADEPCGVIQSQTDVNNNTFGTALMGYPTLAQRTRIDYNDWGHPNIKKCELINCWSNKESCTLIAVRGYAHIYRNKNTSLASVRITDDSVLIYDNTSLTLYDCDVSGNIYLNASTSITYSEINAVVASNFYFTITDCEANSNITSNVSCTVTSSNIFGLLNSNNTCTFVECSLECEVSGNDTCDFVSVNNFYSSASMKNNTNTTFTNVAIFSTYVGVFTGVSNNTNCSLTNVWLYGSICNNIRCEIIDFRIESSSAYVYDCDDLLISNSSLSGISWIKTVCGTAPETRSQIVGCSINGELELLGEGNGGTVVTITDCVIGKSGDIKKVKAGTVTECEIHGNVTDITTLTLTNSYIGTQTDFDDWVTLSIINSEIGASVDANRSSPASQDLSITRCKIHSSSILNPSTLVDSEISGTFGGVSSTGSVILNSTISGLSVIVNSIIHDSIVGAVVTNSRIFNSDFNGTATNSEIYASCTGTLEDTIIESGATIYGISLDCFVFTNCRIGSRADIFKDDYGTLTLTDTDFNGKYECNESSDNNETLTRCVVEYGATILDTLNLTLEDCKLLYGAKLSLTEFYTYKLYKTIIDYDATRPVLYDLSGDTTLGGIGACAYIAGTLRVDQGTWNVGEFLTGYLQTVTQNGVTINNGTGITITAIGSGWYSVDYNSSSSGNAMVFELEFFLGAAEVPQSYKKVSYPATGQSLSMSSHFIIYLSAGQTLTLKQKHDKGSYEDIVISNLTITVNKI